MTLGVGVGPSMVLGTGVGPNMVQGTGAGAHMVLGTGARALIVRINAVRGEEKLNQPFGEERFLQWSVRFEFSIWLNAQEGEDNLNQQKGGKHFPQWSVRFEFPIGGKGSKLQDVWWMRVLGFVVLFNIVRQWWGSRYGGVEQVLGKVDPTPPGLPVLLAGTGTTQG